MLYLTAKQIYTDLTTSEDEETIKTLVRLLIRTYCKLQGLILNIEIRPDRGGTMARVATISETNSPLQQEQTEIQSIDREGSVRARLLQYDVLIDH